MGIVEKLSQLIISKSNLRNKINEKISDTTKQIPESAKLEDFSSYVDNIESGSGEDFEITSGYYLFYDRDDYEFKKMVLPKCKIKTSSSNYTFNVQYMFYNATFYDVMDLIPFFESEQTISKASTGYFQAFPYNTALKFIYARQMFSYANSKNNKDIFINISKDKLLNANNMFYNTPITSLKSVDDELHIFNGTSMFQNCSKLKTVPIFNLEKAYNIENMFGYCSELKEVRFKGRMLGPNCNTNKVTGVGESGTVSLRYVFNNCRNLESITGLDLTNVPNIFMTTSMFGNCTSLTTLDFSGSEDFLIDIDLSQCNSMGEDEFLAMLETMPVSSGNPTIKISKTLMNLLSDETKAAFSAKNYTLIS